MVDKLAVARALREVGMLLEVKGENPFKVRAYETGARAVEELVEDLPTLVREGRLTDVAGIGEALAQKITELCSTGRLPLLERLRSELPAGIGELLKVPDLGPKKIGALCAALGITSVEDLRAACEAGRVRALKGFGEKTEQKILAGIIRLKSREQRFLLSDALEAGELLLGHLRDRGAVEELSIAGSARRGSETVGDLDVVAGSSTPRAAIESLASYPLVEHFAAAGDTKATALLAGGLRVDLHVTGSEDYPALLHARTGSKAHLAKLGVRARERGYSLGERGLRRLQGDPGVAVSTEDEVYQRLGMQPIPPELREDQGEIEAALEGQIPGDLVREEDVQGMVHVHTTWSDGRASLEEMARASQAMGFRYLTVTDHSKSAAYAGGLDVGRLKAQWAEIDRVEQKVGIRLLRGTEADILQDGALDWPDEILEQLDVVIASIHSRMKMDAAAMTRRLVRAMSLPFFKIWGHASGRLLFEREPCMIHMEEVLDAAASSRAAIEVNGDPHRLDMEPRFLRMAKQRGIRFVLATDAHSVAGLRNLRFAVLTARRGWVTTSEVLNALAGEQFARAVRPVS